MRRIALMLIAAMVIAVLPAVALAQVNEEEAAAAALLLRDEADALEGADAAAWADALAALEVTLADLKALAPGLDYTALDAAIADLHTAIEGGDISEIETAGAAVGAEAAEVEAAAEAAAAAAGEDPAGVGTGSEVPNSPNAALLAIAGILALLAGGAMALRWSAVRR